MTVTRRQFLSRTTWTLGAAALSSLHQLSRINAYARAAANDYKALVCVFMGGGNDGNNMVIPAVSTTDLPAGIRYSDYFNVRNGPGLAIAQGQLKLISPATFGVNKFTFGFHTAMPELATLFNTGKLAVACNVGPLLQPLNQQQYLSGAPVPNQLFSHSDQIAEWQSAVAKGPSSTGWGGRIADVMVALNDPNSGRYPVITSVAGSALFALGVSTFPLAIPPAPTALSQALLLSGFGTGTDDKARLTQFNFLRGIDTQNTLVASADQIMQEALDIAAEFTVDPTLTTVFPNTTLGNQLKQVAKVIKLNQTSSKLSLNRQIFFCSLGGFDTHQNQVTTQNSLLIQLSQAMDAFQKATVELGLESNITTFTLSDFARTFRPSGSGGIVGTDHAWGNYQLVMGGAVKGGDFYGNPSSNGTVIPTLAPVNGTWPDDVSRNGQGRWIPTSSVDQYGATLASWFGVSSNDLKNTVFPNLTAFGTDPSTWTLGFMS
jgi:uncharacterized protein (DUF1501 family)